VRPVCRKIGGVTHTLVFLRMNLLVGAEQRADFSEVPVQFS